MKGTGQEQFCLEIHKYKLKFYKSVQKLVFIVYEHAARQKSVTVIIY